MRLRYLALALAAIIVAAACLPKPIANVYVARFGPSLIYNGTEFKFLGYDTDWIGSNNCDGADATKLNSVFSDVSANSGANLVRVGAMQRDNADGTYDFSDFDRYVSYAKTYNLFIVPALLNNWAECDAGGVKRLGFYQGGSTGNTYNTIISPLHHSYHDYAVAFANRYKNESTVAWYQLANEPDARDGNGNCSTTPVPPATLSVETMARNALRNFADTMTTDIKAVDSHHMVDLGAISWCGGQGADYAYVNAGNVDLCDTYHDYGDVTTAMPSEEARHNTACMTTDNKPGYVGESGICATLNAGSCTSTVSTTTLTNRANRFDDKITAADTAGLSGYLVWQADDGCSGSGDTFDVGSQNTVLTCAAPGVDPTETMMNGHT